MEEHPEMRENECDGLPPSIEQKRWLIDFFIVLVIALLAFAYWYRQHLKVRHLTAQESAANVTIDDLQRQLNNLPRPFSRHRFAGNGRAADTRKKRARPRVAHLLLDLLDSAELHPCRALRSARRHARANVFGYEHFEMGTNLLV